MQISGKIIFYNAGDGTGIIMTSKKAKYRFDVADWDDYDVLPETGMEVAFSPDGDIATMITKLLNAEDVGAVVREDDGFKPYDPEAPIPTIVRLRMGPEEAIKDYFDRIEKEIQERTRYKSSPGRIDFLRIRRFLFTTYNNLTELDIHFITPELKAMRDDLLQMSQVYDDYKSKATYPDIAFDKVFLSRQPDYVHLREDSEYRGDDGAYPARIAAVREA